MDLVSESLSYVLPGALVVVTALVSPALVTPRKLRNDLAVDVDLADRLQPAEKADLTAEITRRARYLIAMTRHPALTMYDLLALLGHTALVVMVIVGHVVPMWRRDEVLVDPMTLGVPALFAASCWGAFYVPWSNRAAARLKHIEEHLGEKEAMEAARTVRVAHLAAVLAGPAVILAMQVALAVAVHRVHQSYWLTGSSLLGGVLALCALSLATREVKLNDRLHALSESFQAELRALAAVQEEQELERRQHAGQDGASGPEKRRWPRRRNSN